MAHLLHLLVLDEEAPRDTVCPLYAHVPVGYREKGVRRKGTVSLSRPRGSVLSGPYGSGSFSYWHWMPLPRTYRTRDKVPVSPLMCGGNRSFVPHVSGVSVPLPTLLVSTGVVSVPRNEVTSRGSVPRGEGPSLGAELSEKGERT